MGSNGQNRAYLFSIVLIAVIGGLLFGYDTAVISGAEQALDTFFKGATDFTYTKLLHGFTVSSALLGCIIGGAISGMIASSVGRKKALLLAGILWNSPIRRTVTQSSDCVQHLQDHRRHRRRSGFSHLPHVHRRDITCKHPWYPGLMQPVRHHLRYARGIFRELPHQEQSGRHS